MEIFTSRDLNAELNSTLDCTAAGRHLFFSDTEMPKLAVSVFPCVLTVCVTFCLLLLLY